MLPENHLLPEERSLTFHTQFAAQPAEFKLLIMALDAYNSTETVYDIGKCEKLFPRYAAWYQALIGRDAHPKPDAIVVRSTQIKKSDDERYSVTIRACSSEILALVLKRETPQRSSDLFPPQTPTRPARNNRAGSKGTTLQTEEDAAKFGLH